ncbi:MAG: enoyl-CoA hydratase/isomerase family protein [Rhizomicrobium sp.]
MTDRYASFNRLLFDRPAPYVLRVTINNPEKMNALDAAAHHQLETVWAAIDDDLQTRVSIVTGAGRGFSSGGAFDAMPTESSLDPNQVFSKGFREASRLVSSIINARKPIISAINGPAVGAGLAIALLADIPIAAKQAKLLDGHLRIGVVPGDHAAMIWPLLCGIAKAKYFLMTNATMTGEEAAQINLVALAVDASELQDKAVEVARQLAATAPSALRMTKYALNHWLRQNQPIFDLALAFEMVNFSGDEAKKAMEEMTTKTAANFDDNVQF